MGELLEELGIEITDDMLIVQNSLVVKDVDKYYDIIDVLAETEILYDNEYDSYNGLGLIVLVD